MSGSDPEPPAKVPNDPLPKDGEPISNGLRALVGRNLRAARVAMRLNQQEFAARAGVTQQYLSQVEGGRVNITIDNIRRFAAAVGLTPDVLLRASSTDPGEPDEEPPA